MTDASRCCNCNREYKKRKAAERQGDWRAQCQRANSVAHILSAQRLRSGACVSHVACSALLGINSVHMIRFLVTVELSNCNKLLTALVLKLSALVEVEDPERAPLSQFAIQVVNNPRL